MHQIKPPLIYWRDWEKYFHYPKTGTLKYALLNRKDTGFDKCVRRINRRIYLDVDSTFAYFDSCKDL